MAKKRTLKPGISPLHFFGSEVCLAREAAGTSQLKLGKMANCDTSLVSRIEGGQADPSLGFPEACDTAFPHMNGFFTRFWNEHQDWPGGMFPQWADPWMTSEGREAEMSRRSHITVQIVPAEIGAHAGLDGGFMIARCPGKPDILHVDAVVGQTFKNRPLVTDFATAFEDIRAEALPASRSRDLTLGEAEERWQS